MEIRSTEPRLDSGPSRSADGAELLTTGEFTLKPVIPAGFSVEVTYVTVEVPRLAKAGEYISRVSPGLMGRHDVSKQLRVATMMDLKGLKNWMDDRGHGSLDDIVGRATPNISDWQYLNLNYVAKANINQDLCIKCGRCHIACEDTSHQAISALINGQRHFEVIEEECVGCNLCVNVCPVEGCITMEPLAAGALDKRTGKTVSPNYANWTTHPNNPMAKVAAE